MAKYKLPNKIYPAKGQHFTAPSITQPDLCYSIQQLAAQYSVGMMPTLAQAGEWADEDDEYMEEHLDETNQLQFADKAEAAFMSLQSSHLRKSITEKIKKMREFKKQQSEMRDKPAPEEE